MSSGLFDVELPPPQLPLTISSHVLAALESERAYQRRTNPAAFEHGGAPSFEAELLLISEYSRLAIEAWSTQRGNAAAQEQLRKLGGVLVRCLENHGVPMRS